MSFADKKLTVGAAGPGTPWGTIAQIIVKALKPHGYDINIERDASRGRCPPMLNKGLVDFGVHGENFVQWAREGRYDYAKEGKMPRLRSIATIMFPSYYSIAVRWETNITDLKQIKERKLPVRIFGIRGPMSDRILEYYGLSTEIIESFGGKFMPFHPPVPGGDALMAPWMRTNEVDVIIDNIYASYTIEACYVWEASVLMNLRFLPMPDDLLRKLADEFGGEPALMPFRLVRGVNAPTPALLRSGQTVFARDDMPDDFAYLLAKSLDDNRHLFRETHIPYSYDERQVVRDQGAPLHPGAAKYYRESGYLK